MTSNDFVKFLEASQKMQKGKSGMTDHDLSNGVYFHRWENTVFVMCMNGCEMYWEKFDELDAAGKLDWLDAGALDAAQEAGLFPCKITGDAVKTLLTELKAIKKSQSNNNFHWLDFVPGAIKAVCYGKDIDIPVIPVADKDDEGFMFLYRRMVLRDAAMPNSAALCPAKHAVQCVKLPAMANICAWFAGHTDKPDGMVMRAWDYSGKSVAPNHVIMWPDYGVSILGAPYGAISMQRVDAEIYYTMEEAING